jgi:hypothetical protein
MDVPGVTRPLYFGDALIIDFRFNVGGLLREPLVGLASLFERPHLSKIAMDTDFAVDERVWLRSDDVAIGKDSVVEAALQWINQQLAASVHPFAPSSRAGQSARARRN